MTRTTVFEAMRRIAQEDANRYGKSIAILDISKTLTPVYIVALMRKVRRPDQLVAIVQPCAH